jgi:hypothetical protein
VISGRNCRDATLTLLGSLGLQQKKRITQVSGCQYGFEAGMETDRALVAARIYDATFSRNCNVADSVTERNLASVNSTREAHAHTD